MTGSGGRAEQDSTERARGDGRTAETLARHELARVSRLHTALAHINRVLVRARQRDGLFDDVCRILVEQGGFGMAWVGWHEPRSRALKVVASSGDRDDYLSRIELYTDERLEGQGPAGTAFREQRPYVANDIETDPAPLAWLTELRKSGFRSLACFPISDSGVVSGVLTVYARDVGFFQDREVELLAEAASTVSFVLENMRRAAEREIAYAELQNEQRFSDAMIESMPGILYFYDETGRFLRWNHSFETISGYSGAEIATMHPLDFFPVEHKAAVAARIAQVFDSGSSVIEAPFRAKDGTATAFYFTGRRTVFGGVRCLVGMGIDISERQRAEQARAISETRYRTLFEHAPDGILIADPRSTYIDANPSMCALLGYARDELVGLHASDIVGTDELGLIEPALDSIHREPIYSREWTLKRKDGSTFPAGVTVTQMPDGNLLALVRDVTERKKAEHALRELNETLELKVEQRTTELSAALVRAEAADRIKSAFLATMSHELRTPLNSIIGFTGIVLQRLAGPLNDEQAKQLGMVRSSARHLLDLINDVLDLSKIEADQLEMRSEPFDLREVIEHVIALVRPMANKKELELHAAIVPELGEMVSDRRRVEQILLNLVNNALKFTDRGSVHVRAERITRVDPQGSERPMVSIRISDTGIGITPEELATLFVPFRQIDTGLARQHEGTGLGLAICKRLVGLLGGEIKASSTWAKGTELTVVLPLARSAAS